MVTSPHCHRALGIDDVTARVRGSFVAAVDGRVYFNDSLIIGNRRLAGMIAHLMRASPETTTHEDLAAIVDYRGEKPAQIVGVYLSRAHAAARAAGVTLPVQTLMGRGYRWADSCDSFTPGTISTLSMTGSPAGAKVISVPS